MFTPAERRISVRSVKALAGLMQRLSGPPRPNDAIPAGFTYLGQFIDHDLTFDPTPTPARRRDPRKVVNFRTPRYDLDSVYGLGPVVQPYLYDADGSLLVGRGTDAPRSAGSPAKHDLPRNQQGRALIGDARNDENVIVAQLHLLFIRFHNAVMADVRDFEEARRIVRWHYQWIVRRHFLPRVVGERQARRVDRRHFKWEREPFIPVEFSGAAFRFGHSMVRDRYGLKKLPPPGTMGPPALRLFPDLQRSAWLPERLRIDWERFFDLTDREPQSSFSIDPSLTRPLFELPDDGGSLPLRNLMRGLRLGLPSGQEVARAMELPELPEGALKLDGQIKGKAREELLSATPLWFYILCEANHASQGAHLGPVGGRIVTEVLTGLLEGDPESYLRKDPSWRPTLGTERDFTMADLIAFTG